MPALRRTHDCSCHNEQDVALLRPCQTDGPPKRSNVASAHQGEKLGRLTPQRAQRRSKPLLSLQTERCALAYDKFEEGSDVTSPHRKRSLVGCASSALKTSMPRLKRAWRSEELLVTIHGLGILNASDRRFQ